MRVMRLTPDARLPERAHATDAGLDLFTRDEVHLNPGDIVRIPTGIAIALPPGHVGLIYDKSGRAASGLTVLGGVIDEPYRGELVAVIHNVSREPRYLAAHEKVAQLLVLPVSYVTVEDVPELDSTDRGDRGFGSTGLAVSALAHSGDVDVGFTPVGTGAVDMYVCNRCGYVRHGVGRCAKCGNALPLGGS